MKICPQPTHFPLIDFEARFRVSVQAGVASSFPPSVGLSLPPAPPKTFIRTKENSALTTERPEGSGGPPFGPRRNLAFPPQTGLLLPARDVCARGCLFIVVARPEFVDKTDRILLLIEDFGHETPVVSIGMGAFLMLASNEEALAVESLPQIESVALSPPLSKVCVSDAHAIHKPQNPYWRIVSLRLVRLFQEGGRTTDSRSTPWQTPFFRLFRFRRVSPTALELSATKCQTGSRSTQPSQGGIQTKCPLSLLHCADSFQQYASLPLPYLLHALVRLYALAPPFLFCSISAPRSHLPPPCIPLPFHFPSSIPR